MKWFDYDNPAFKVKVLDYTYTSQPSINSALPIKTSKLKTIVFYIGVIISFGFIWLLGKWSAKRKAFFTSSICLLQHATHFLIHDQDAQGQMTIVKRIDKYEMRFKRTCIAFIYHDRTYIYIEQKEVFVPIRYEELGLHLDRLRRDKFIPYTNQKRQKLLEYYGLNVMKLQVQSRLQIFIQSMLTPYEVFQTYGIILCIFQQYYIFAFILLAYSLYTYWTNSSEIRSNQQSLAFESYFQVQTKVLINDQPTPGDSDDINQQVELCNRSKQLDQHRSDIMKDNFNQIEMNQNDHEITIPKASQRRRSHQVKNDENNLINNRNIRFNTISSHRLVPGDIIILNEGDIVPCDCILLRGQALVNEKYSTGDNYLTRKEEVQNFTYQKENQKGFVLYLGTEVVKIKNVEYRQRAMRKDQRDNEESSLQEHSNGVPEIVCLVTQTNFNTLRGKYLRAIRYQCKNQQQFFRQTIYFIYIILLLTSIIYFVYLAELGPHTKELDMFLLFIQLLITAIPPTLPTILSLGIQFVTHRLKGQGINCVIPKSILTGGKVDTVILKGDEVFGKEYEINSAAIGTKGERGFGLTFSNIQEFYNHHTNQTMSYIDIGDLRRKISQKNQAYKLGTYFISSLASCHTLQFYNHQIHGCEIDKQIYHFSEPKFIKDDHFQTRHHHISIRKVIRFKTKSMKIAVLVDLKEKAQQQLRIHSKIKKQEQLQGVNVNVDESTVKHYKKHSFLDENDYHQEQNTKKIKRCIFLKGTAEKVLTQCLANSYPESAHSYIVDMAQKGFIVYAYAMKILPHDSWEGVDYHQIVSSGRFQFLGFIIINQVRSSQNLQAIQDLRQADVRLVFVSEQRELEAASKAMINGICDKNQLLLCSLSKDHQKILCKGHIEWQSSSNDIYSEFLTEFDEFGKNSKVCLSSNLYEQIYLKRDINLAAHLFDKTAILNKTEVRHEKNLYGQLQRKGRICCAVGRSGQLYELADLSIELQREKSALLSSFYTSSTNLSTIVSCLRICRAGLSTNFHGFSMMILFSLIQFTTVVILNLNYQSLSDDQSLYEDLFITFPIFVTINLTQPALKLSKQLPPNSFFSCRHMVSMVGQLLIQFFAQLGFILYVLSLDYFKQQRINAKVHYYQTGQFTNGSALSLALFVLSNNIYLGIVLSTSVSKPFRKPFYTNPFYTVNLMLLWCYNTFIVIFPSISPSGMRQKHLNQQSQSILIVALLLGNLIMVIMYLFENLIVFLWSKENPCLKKVENNQNQIRMDDVIK